MQMPFAAAVPAEVVRHRARTRGLWFRVEALTRVALAGTEVAGSCIYHYVCHETRFHRVPLLARISSSALVMWV